MVDATAEQSIDHGAESQSSAVILHGGFKVSGCKRVRDLFVFHGFLLGLKSENPTVPRREHVLDQGVSPPGCC